MLKHHPKLRRLWKNCEILSKISHQEIYTETFMEEFHKVIKKELIGDSVKEKIIGEVWMEIIKNN